MELPSKDQIAADVAGAKEEAHAIATWCAAHPMAAGVIIGIVVGLVLSWVF